MPTPSNNPTDSDDHEQTGLTTFGLGTAPATEDTSPRRDPPTLTKGPMLSTKGQDGWRDVGYVCETPDREGKAFALRPRDPDTHRIKYLNQTDDPATSGSYAISVEGVVGLFDSYGVETVFVAETTGRVLEFDAQQFIDNEGGVDERFHAPTDPQVGVAVAAARAVYHDFDLFHDDTPSATGFGGDGGGE